MLALEPKQPLSWPTFREAMCPPRTSPMSGGFPPISNFGGIARDLSVTTQGRGCLPESRPGWFGSERSAAMAEVEQILKKDNYKHFASRETGDDIERPDVQGLTMLMWASAYGQTPTVQVGFWSFDVDFNFGNYLPFHLLCGKCSELWTCILSWTSPQQLAKISNDHASIYTFSYCWVEKFHSKFPFQL